MAPHSGVAALWSPRRLIADRADVLLNLVGSILLGPRPPSSLPPELMRFVAVVAAAFLLCAGGGAAAQNVDIGIQLRGLDVHSAQRSGRA